MKQSSQHSGSERHADEGSAVCSLTTRVPTAPKRIYLRYGEPVLYRRPRSLLYRCRCKRPDGTWYRQSTGKASLEQALPEPATSTKRLATQAALFSAKEGYSKIATARVQPADAPRILCGKQLIVNPCGGSASRLCSFSRWQ